MDSVSEGIDALLTSGYPSIGEKMPACRILAAIYGSRCLKLLEMLLDVFDLDAKTAGKRCVARSLIEVVQKLLELHLENTLEISRHSVQRAGNYCFSYLLCQHHPSSS